MMAEECLSSHLCHLLDCFRSDPDTLTTSKYFDLVSTNEPFDWHPLRLDHSVIETIDITLSIFSLSDQPNEQRLQRIRIQKWYNIIARAQWFWPQDINIELSRMYTLQFLMFTQSHSLWRVHEWMVLKNRKQTNEKINKIQMQKYITIKT